MTYKNNYKNNYLLPLVPDVYNNDINMYIVHGIPCVCTLRVSNNVCMSLTSTVHVYDLLHKLSIADNNLR